MSIKMLTEDLLDSIKRRSLIPISQQTFQDSDLIALANEEMGITLVPEIQKVREDMFLALKEVSIASGISRYVIPERSIGNSVKAVLINTSDDNNYVLPRENVSKAVSGSNYLGTPGMFYLEDNYVVLNPPPSTSGTTLNLWYYSRPNELVETSDCAKITAISSVGGTTTFTVDTNMSSTWAVGDLVDVLSNRSPFILWGEDCAITAITSTTIEIATTSVDNEAGSVAASVGDYICPAKKANIPMIPQEFHPVLAQMVTCRLLEALGDLNKLNASLAKLAEMKSNAMALIQNRVEDSVEYFNNRNSLSRSTGSYGKRTLY